MSHAQSRMWLILLVLLMFVAVGPEMSLAVSLPVETLGSLHTHPGFDLAGKESYQSPANCDVGYVTDAGGINDGGANRYSYQGLMRAKLDFGVQVQWIESRRTEDYEPNLRQLVNQGCRLILSLGFTMYEATERVALENPSVRFTIVDMSSLNAVPNLRGVVFDNYEQGYLAGALAGLMTESDVVGIVAGMEIPVVISIRTGYEAGALEFNPAVTRLGVYIPSFTDPEAGAQQASIFMAAGADVIFGAAGPTGSGAIRYAAQNGVWAIGVDQDEYYTTFAAGNLPGSRYLLSSAIKLYDNAAYDTVVDFLNGTFTGGNKVYGLSNDGVGLAPFHDADPDVPQDVREALAAIGYSEQAVSAVVTPQGGSLTSLDGLVGLQFPAGAFPNQVEITYQPQNGQPPDNLTAIDRFFEIGVAELRQQRSNTDTLLTYTIEVQYRNHETLSIAESSLGLYWWNGAQWQREPSSTLAASENRITATPSHLGRFAVFGEGTMPAMYLPLVNGRD